MTGCAEDRLLEEKLYVVALREQGLSIVVYSALGFCYFEMFVKVVEESWW